MRTTNDLEQYNSTLERQRRRITGRKETADYITRHGPYVVFFDPDESAEQVSARFRRFQPQSFTQNGLASLLLRPANGEFVVFGVTPTASSSGLSLSGATTPPDAIMLVLL